MHTIRHKGQGELNFISGTPIPQPGEVSHLDLSQYDGLPMPTDLDLAVAIMKRCQAGHLLAAAGLISQFRVRLLYHVPSQEQAKAHGGNGSTSFP